MCDEPVLFPDWIREDRRPDHRPEKEPSLTAAAGDLFSALIGANRAVRILNDPKKLSEHLLNVYGISVELKLPKIPRSDRAPWNTPNAGPYEHETQHANFALARVFCRRIILENGTEVDPITLQPTLYYE